MEDMTFMCFYSLNSLCILSSVIAGFFTIPGTLEPERKEEET